MIGGWDGERWRWRDGDEMERQAGRQAGEDGCASGGKGIRSRARETEAHRWQ